MDSLAEAERGQGVPELVRGIAANEHAQVLIVGCRGDNFPPDYHAHPQLVFWEGDWAVSKDIPQRTRLLLITKFLSHAGFARLRSQAQQRNVTFVSTAMGTGEIKTLLEPILEAKKKVITLAPAAGSSVPKKLKRFMRGSLQTFIKQHGNLYAPKRVVEAKRLTALAAEQGFSTTTASVAQSMRMLVGSGKTHAKAVADTTARVAVVTASTQADPSDDDTTILRMLDDVHAAIGLIREPVVKRGEKRRQLKQLLKEL